MSTSTDAHIAFGFELTDADEQLPVAFLDEEGEEKDIEETILRAYGLWTEDTSGDTPWPDHEDRSPETEALCDRLMAPYRANSEAEMMVPVTLIRHCSGECPMYIVAVKESHKRANRGYPIKVRKDREGTIQLGGQPGISIPSCRELVWAGQVVEFCQKLGIEHKQPEWLLFSDWK